MPSTASKSSVHQDEQKKKKVFVSKIKDTIEYLTTHKKQLFWYWVVYQAIKGILTTSLIWIPLIYLWLKG